MPAARAASTVSSSVARALCSGVQPSSLRARDELGWVPEHGSQATLTETVDAARAAGTVQ